MLPKWNRVNWGHWILEPCAYLGITICKVHFLQKFITEFLQLEVKKLYQNDLHSTFLSTISNRNKINQCTYFATKFFVISVTSRKNWLLYLGSRWQKILSFWWRPYWIEESVQFLPEKGHFKPGTMLIETLLSRNPLK